MTRQQFEDRGYTQQEYDEAVAALRGNGCDGGLTWEMVSECIEAERAA